MQVVLEGRRLSLDEQGPPDARHTVVLLHAFPFDRRFWSGLTPVLTAAGVRVIAPDFRGFGESVMALGRHSIADLADDIAHLLDHVRAPRVVLVGVSMGGYVALAFAQRHRQRLAGLVLADTRASGDSPAGREGRDEAIALVRSQGAPALLDTLAGKLPGAHADAPLRKHIRDLMAEAPDGVCAALAAMRDRPDRSEELASIAHPTLVIVGADDQITPPAEARATAAAIRKAQLIEIPGAGHLPNLEKPDAFQKALLGFLSDLRAM